MEPILKWAGGKRQLLKELLKHVSQDDLIGHTYFEPFIGGGALLLQLVPHNAVINDVNYELISMYETIKSNPKELIDRLTEYKAGYPNNFDEIRAMDRNPDFLSISKIDRAARFIYLNKTCYNGLYRVNSQGYFNVPMGRYRNPKIVDSFRINKLSDYFNKNKIKMKHVDFAKAVSTAKKGDFVYFDPPYDYESSGFTTYSADGFSHDDLLRLKKKCDELIELGCTVMISNNDTKYVLYLFSGNKYQIFHVEANRFINCDGQKRTRAMEVIIYGKK